jgi:small neutral amino acid transporter SnatA (MarC family)
MYFYKQKTLRKLKMLLKLIFSLFRLTNRLSNDDLITALRKASIPEKKSKVAMASFALALSVSL